MKIDKYLAYKIAGSDFKLLEVSTGKIYRTTIPSDYGIYTRDENDKVLFVANSKIGTDYKVISRTMDLTKPIIVQGKEVVPYLELAKTAYSHIDWFLTKNNKVVANGDKEFVYYPKAKSFTTYVHTHMTVTCGNQSDLFQWLEKHHFCYFLPDEMIHFDDEMYNN